jgi:protein-arginine kinase activator protein McsA
VAARRRVDTHKHAKQRRISTCSVWDDSMTLADLRQQLDAAVSKEDYSLAAQLRDTLQ